MIVNVEDVVSHRYVIELDDNEHEILVKALGLAATYSNETFWEEVLDIRAELIVDG